MPKVSKEEEKEEGKVEEGQEKEKEEKRRPRASNGQRCPLPCCIYYGNLECAQQGKGYC